MSRCINCRYQHGHQIGCPLNPVDIGLRKGLTNGFYADGETYEQARDSSRLAAQMKSVFELMKDGRERTLKEIADGTGSPESSVSARLRDLRKERFGGYTVNRFYIARGLFSYQLLVTEAAC